MMTVDPKWGFWLNVAGVVLTALIGVSWATVLDAKQAASLMSLLSGAYTIVNAILHGISAPVPGPITKLLNPAS